MPRGTNIPDMQKIKRLLQKRTKQAHKTFVIVGACTMRM
jgi:hypothetical protein